MLLDEAATEAVVTAEVVIVDLSTKVLVDTATGLYNTANGLVTALPEGTVKDDLTARLVVVEEAIEEAQVLLDKAVEESTAAETNTTETTVTGITVIGSEDFKNKTKLAFSLLYDKARNYYDMVLKYVGIIEYADKGTGMYSWENPPRYKVGKATVDAGTIWYAGTIVHDATHSKLYNDYLATYPSESVPEDIYSGEKAEAICLNVQYDALSKIGADQETLDYVKNAINTKYWEIPYNERWW